MAVSRGAGNRAVQVQGQIRATLHRDQVVPGIVVVSACAVDARAAADAGGEAVQVAHLAIAAHFEQDAVGVATGVGGGQEVLSRGHAGLEPERDAVIRLGKVQAARQREVIICPVKLRRVTILAAHPGGGAGAAGAGPRLVRYDAVFERGGTCRVVEPQVQARVLGRQRQGQLGAGGGGVYLESD